jgi:outer membrane protein OmpA-like peptidoglycan-associated protein
VAAYLKSQGIDDLRFLVRGFGPDRPVADRRVELTLVPLTS